MKFSNLMHYWAQIDVYVSKNILKPILPSLFKMKACHKPAMVGKNSYSGLFFKRLYSSADVLAFKIEFGLCAL